MTLPSCQIGAITFGIASYSVGRIAATDLYKTLRAAST